MGTHQASDNRVAAKIGVVINAEAGREQQGNLAARARQEVQDRLQARTTPGCFSVVSGAEVEAEIKRMFREGVDILVVGGGDGTLSTAAGLLRDSRTALYPLPWGTKNHFARDLGIPGDLREAVRVLDAAPVRWVDLGEVNGRYFLNNVSVGIYPEIVKKRHEHMRRHGWRKRKADLFAAFAVLRRLPRMRITIEEPGSRTRCLTPFLFVGNNEYGGDGRPEPGRSSLAEGCLWVSTGRVTGIWSLLHMAWRLLTGRIDSIEELDVFQAKEITVSFHSRKVSVAVDGEVVTMTTPLRFRSRPACLAVVAP